MANGPLAFAALKQSAQVSPLAKVQARGEVVVAVMIWPPFPARRPLNVVEPVPPLPPSKVPAIVIVPAPVIAPPLVVSPVEPPETSTEVTVPPPAQLPLSIRKHPPRSLTPFAKVEVAEPVTAKYPVVVAF